jgi:RNA-binding protein
MGHAQESCRLPPYPTGKDAIRAAEGARIHAGSRDGSPVGYWFSTREPIGANSARMTQPKRRKPDYELSGKQRGALRALAHHLSPLVQIGKDGLTEGVVAAAEEALGMHELVKVRVLESSPASRSELAGPLAAATGSHLVGQVGRIVMLYRMHEEKPTIELPKR